MNNLKAGFSRMDITPCIGTPLGGMFEDRRNIETLDPLFVSCLALSDGNNVTLLVSADILYFSNELLEMVKNEVTALTGVPKDYIFAHGTHNHNGPDDMVNKENKLLYEYHVFLSHRIADVCFHAISDLKPTTMYWTVGKAPNVAFIRLFRMKDGSLVTNPGINNPDILEPANKLDDRVNVLRFDRGPGDTITLVNFGNHPCVVNGPRVSADWPGFMRDTVEMAIPETKCIFFNGCQGDVNHVNVFPNETDRYLNYDPDDKYKEVRYTFARYMGRAMAGTVLQEYDKGKKVDVESITSVMKTISVPSNKGTAEELEKAYALKEQCDKIGIPEMRKILPEMEFETEMGKAGRIIRLKDAPDTYEMDVMIVKVGPVALVGMPGEPFSGVSFMLKETEGYDMILPCCCTNGRAGYFPMLADYEGGAYETGTSNFKAGGAEYMVHECKTILADLLNN